MESFIDELAHAAGKDPLEFRRSLTDRADALAVLNKLAEMSNWSSKLPKGTGRGISLADNHGAIGGHVAEVTVDDRGAVRVTRVFAATDAYHVVNPNLVAHDHPNLYLLGASAHVTAPINPPTLTIAACAMRAADHLLGSRGA